MPNFWSPGDRQEAHRFTFVNGGENFGLRGIGAPYVGGTEEAECRHACRQGIGVDLRRHYLAAGVLSADQSFNREVIGILRSIAAAMPCRIAILRSDRWLCRF